MHFIDWLFGLEVPNTNAVHQASPVEFDLIEEPRTITDSNDDGTDEDEEDDEDWDDDD